MPLLQLVVHLFDAQHPPPPQSVGYVVITCHLLTLKHRVLCWVSLLLPDALQPAVDPQNLTH